MKLTPLFVLTLALLGSANAQAQFFYDPVLQALMAAEKMAAEKFAELDNLARQRTAARADDAQAVLGLALADERFEAASAGLSALPVGADDRLADDVQQWLAAAGFGLLGKGQAAPAKAALARFVAAGKGNGKALDDAKKRLVQLGQPAG